MGHPSQAERVARALNGRRAGAGWLAYCVCHNNTNTPSLSLRDGADGLLVYCWGAGCNPLDILRELRRRNLLGDDRPDRDRRPPVIMKSTDIGQLALDIWRECVPLGGKLGEVYLAKRGLVLPLGAEMRFHPRCPRQRDRQPAIIWLLRDVYTNQPRGEEKADAARKLEAHILAVAEPQKPDRPKRRL